MNKIKIGFWGTPELAKKVLEDLYNDGDFEIKFVVTSPDKPVGRKMIFTPTPVKSFATVNNLQVFTPEKVRGNIVFLTEIKNIEVDYFVVVAYGKILPKEVLEIPKNKCINVHGSILPKYRGASPIQSSLMAGDEVTGVTIMKMSEGMDEGDILEIKEINIDKFDTSEILFKKFEKVSGEFLASVLKKDYNGLIDKKTQDHKKATYCKKILKEDGLLNPQENAQNIFYKWRGLTPWPGIFTFFQGKKLIITKCDYIENGKYSSLRGTKQSIKNSPMDCHDFSNEKSCNDDDGEKSINNIGKVIKTTSGYGIVCGNSSILELTEVKMEGKNTLNIKDFINGYKDFVGYKIG